MKKYSRLSSAAVVIGNTQRSIARSFGNNVEADQTNDISLLHLKQQFLRKKKFTSEVKLNFCNV